MAITSLYPKAYMSGINFEIVNGRVIKVVDQSSEHSRNSSSKYSLSNSKNSSSSGKNTVVGQDKNSNPPRQSRIPRMNRNSSHSYTQSHDLGQASYKMSNQHLKEELEKLSNKIKQKASNLSKSKSKSSSKNRPRKSSIEETNQLLEKLSNNETLYYRDNFNNLYKSNSHLNLNQVGRSYDRYDNLNQSQSRIKKSKSSQPITRSSKTASKYSDFNPRNSNPTSYSTVRQRHAGGGLNGNYGEVLTSPMDNYYDTLPNVNDLYSAQEQVKTLRKEVKSLTRILEQKLRQRKSYMQQEENLKKEKLLGIFDQEFKRFSGVSKSDKSLSINQKIPFPVHNTNSNSSKNKINCINLCPTCTNQKNRLRKSKVIRTVLKNASIKLLLFSTHSILFSFLKNIRLCFLFYLSFEIKISLK